MQRFLFLAQLSAFPPFSVWTSSITSKHSAASLCCKQYPILQGPHSFPELSLSIPHYLYLYLRFHSCPKLLAINISPLNLKRLISVYTHTLAHFANRFCLTLSRTSAKLLSSDRFPRPLTVRIRWYLISTYLKRALETPRFRHLSRS